MGESPGRFPNRAPVLESRFMYFTDAHEELRTHIRRFLEREVVPNLAEWEETLFPDSVM